MCVSDQGYSASLPVPVLGQVLSEHAVLACTVSSWPVMLTFFLCSCLVMFSGPWFRVGFSDFPCGMNCVTRIVSSVRHVTCRQYDITSTTTCQYIVVSVLCHQYDIPV